MVNIPIYISLIFILTILATLGLFYWVLKTSVTTSTQNIALKVAIGLLFWLIIQSALSLLNVYNTNIDAMPPKIILFGVIPNILIIISLFITNKGRSFIDSLSPKKMMYIHLVRIPVELLLFSLFNYNAVPKQMTFEGLNFDIFAGVTCLVFIYFEYKNFKLNNSILLIWNILCLALLLNIIVIAVLSAPSPIQQIAFEQPNIAILYFPFCLLPIFIVPIVLFSHLVSIRQLTKYKRLEKHVINH